MSRPPTLLLALLVSATFLAGCIAGDEPIDATADTELDDGGLIDAENSTLALTEAGTPIVRDVGWEIGDWWELQMNMNGQPTTFKIIVAEETTSTWRLLSDKIEAAREEAMVDWWLLGEMSKGTVVHQHEDGAWTWYQFPLADGTTWTDNIEWGDDVETLTHTATYSEAIPTPEGDRPGFLIDVTVGETNMGLHYDYIPAMRSFANWRVTHDGQDTFGFNVRSYGRGYEGDVLDAAAETLIEHDHYMVGEAPDLRHEEAPVVTFDVGAAYDEISFEIGSWASSGAAATRLFDPAGTTYETAAQAAPNGDPSWDIQRHHVDPEPGQWKIVAASAGTSYWAWVDAYGITVETIPITAN